uniref:Uncharacterized protein n=1 Tax=Arundo donax TaxID=35708 RepID=A0A0A9FDG2_ARUDO
MFFYSISLHTQVCNLDVFSMYILYMVGFLYIDSISQRVFN